MAFTLTSPDFPHQGAMPSHFTCQGRDVSPALTWSAPPDGTASLALIVDDPDAPDPARPQRVWVHWVLYDLPPATRGLPQGVEATGLLPVGTRQGLNDWSRRGYNGPCPPIGRHRYFFKLFALDCVVPDLHEPTKAQLLQAMAGHTLASAELMGTYQKTAAAGKA